jgi:tyrosyl-tRNA synthetase
MTVEEQARILAQGTEEILPEGSLPERLERCAREGRPLRVKQGFDPTAPDIHLGHAVGLRKLRQFQSLGHQIVLIVGDYTGRVGDPSGVSKTRPQLSEEQIEANARTYLEQFYRVLERDPHPPERPVEVHRNGEWFASMPFMEVIRLAARYTVARMLERDDFAKRMAAHQPIGVHELFYPLMQGFDSVAIRSDIEIGGTDQKFNLLVGRALQESEGQLPQLALTVPILPGLDGVQRMSKSLGNYVGVTDAPAEMFGKIMSLPDSSMSIYWRLAADLPEAELAQIGRELADSQVHPMSIKKRLGQRIVSLYHGNDAAENAQRDFEAQFGRGEAPSSIPTWTADQDGEMGIKDLLVRSGLAASGSAAWRAVDQGAVSIDGVRISDRNHRHKLLDPFVLRLGRRMLRVEPPAR